MKFYVLDENNNKVEAFDKQGVLALLAQAIADGTLDSITADSAFINKIKCCVSGTTYNIAFTTQAYYNNLVATGAVKTNTYYYIIDDTTGEDIDKALENINKSITTINEKLITLPSFSKKSEARQYISRADFGAANRNLFDININTDFSKNNRVDLSSFLLDGKSYEDTIGISGTLQINFYTTDINGEQVEVNQENVNFSTLWSINNPPSSKFTTYIRPLINNWYINHLVMLDLGIDENNKLYLLSLPEIYRMFTGTGGIYKVDIVDLNIFYK